MSKFFDIDLLLQHALPIALFLSAILLCFFLECRFRRQREDPSRVRGGILSHLFSFFSVLLSAGLLFYLFSVGAGAELLLPVCLLCLFGALL